MAEWSLYWVDLLKFFIPVVVKSYNKRHPLKGDLHVSLLMEVTGLGMRKLPGYIYLYLFDL